MREADMFKDDKQTVGTRKANCVEEVREEGDENEDKDHDICDRSV